MSWLTDNLLFDVIVVVATLQYATSRTKSQLVDDMNNDNHCSLDSIGTKERKENKNNKSFHTDHLITTKRVFLLSSQYRLLYFKTIPQNILKTIF